MTDLELSLFIVAFAGVTIFNTTINGGKYYTFISEIIIIILAALINVF